MHNLRLGLAADELYNEFWHWYCDECIEAAKKGEISFEVLFSTLTTFLKLLHPFMPFVTEQIWQELHQEKVVTDQLLITATWPTAAE